MEPDVRRVMDALRWIVRELRLTKHPGVQGVPLSAAQVFVLHVLKEAGPLGVTELAERTATDPSSVSVVVRKLHEKGLVGKRPKAEDRRCLQVTLSAKGARAMEKTPAPAQERLMGRMAGMRPEELRGLADLLERLAPADRGEEPAPMFFQEP